MIWSQAKTNVAILSLCQAMTNTTNAVILTVSGLTGLMLAPDKSFANMPLALQFLGTALTAAPASFFPGRRDKQNVRSRIDAMRPKLAAAWTREPPPRSATSRTFSPRFPCAVLPSIVILQLLDIDYP